MEKLNLETYGQIADLMKQRTSYVEQKKMLTGLDNKLQVVTNQDGRDNLVGNIRCDRIRRGAADACDVCIAEIDAQLEMLGFDIASLQG